MNEFTMIMSAVGGGSLMSAIVTFFLTKRKYGAETNSIEIKNKKAAHLIHKETDSAEIRNLKDGIAVYTEIIESLKSELEYLREEVKEARGEVKEVREELERKNKECT